MRDAPRGIVEALQRTFLQSDGGEGFSCPVMTRNRSSIPCTALVLGAALAGLAYAPEAHAAVFNVNSIGDVADAVPGDGACATPFNFCTLRAAICEANALPGPDTIQLNANLTTISLVNTGSGEDACLTGDLDITSDIIIVGNGAVIDGLSADRIFDVHPDAVVEISDVTIFDGYVGFAGPVGGAIRNAGDLLLTASTVETSNATQGGAIHNASGASLTVADSDFNDNGSNFGGAIYSAGALDVDASDFLDNDAEVDGGAFFIQAGGPLALIEDSRIVRGSANGNGGGIAAAGAVKVLRSVVRLSDADFGGGLFVAATGGALVLTAKIFDNGASTRGGGVFNKGSLECRDCWVHDNLSATDGGGLDNSGSAVLRRATFGDNNASDGAGIFSEGTLDAFNVTVSGNVASNVGGGVYLDNGTSTFNNVTVVDNAGASGGVFIDPLATFVTSNTIVGDNFNGAIPSDCAGALISGDHNLIEDTAACVITGATANDIYGATPNLGPLQFNGGLTPTHEVLIGSPALDAGNNATCQSIDQRKVSRPQGPSCEIGAYERD
jgi:hypothetical protein